MDLVFVSRTVVGVSVVRANKVIRVDLPRSGDVTSATPTNLASILTC